MEIDSLELCIAMNCSADKLTEVAKLHTAKIYAVAGVVAVFIVVAGAILWTYLKYNCK